jgi:hypothetical protein
MIQGLFSFYRWLQQGGGAHRKRTLQNLFLMGAAAALRSSALKPLSKKMYFLASFIVTHWMLRLTGFQIMSTEIALEYSFSKNLSAEGCHFYFLFLLLFFWFISSYSLGIIFNADQRNCLGTQVRDFVPLRQQKMAKYR